MKNLHVLPTEKPSRLSILNSGKLNFGAEVMSSSNSKPQHLYLTSDEEIKYDEYYLSWQDYYNPPKYVIYVKSSGVNGNGNKIILTTDQDLIADGVQAINDEFLEWFVNNPNCEFVEVQKWFDGLDFLEYKIIIPQEEAYDRTYQPIILSDIDKEEPKQETLEEAAYKNCKQSGFSYTSYAGHCIQSFIAGVKWQQERMYSEEEALELIDNFDGNVRLAKKWFEQHKKK